MVAQRGAGVDIDVRVMHGVQTPQRKQRVLQPVEEVAHQIQLQAGSGQHRPAAGPEVKLLLNCQDIGSPAPV